LCCFLLLAVATLAALCSPMAFAQDPADLRRLLEQRIDQQAETREQALLKDQQEVAEAGERPTLTIDGRSYTIEHTVDDVGRALYVALQQQQWALAAHFLDEYLGLEGRDPLLQHYAQGSLARVQGQHRRAASEFQALLALQPGFLPAQLELARTLFEDQQDREAQAQFAAIAASLDSNDPKTEGVRQTVATFSEALHQRARWNGSVAVGPTWTDNVNRTSASQTCLWLHESGICLISRVLPEAVQASGLDMEASATRRIALSGHHGLYLRALAFGQSWRTLSPYNELNATVQAGYAYRSARHTIVLAPSFDYYALGNHALSGAWGMHGEWSWSSTPRSLLKLETDWKAVRYRQLPYAQNYDGQQRSLSATWFRRLGSHWTVFAGADLIDSQAPEPSNAYRAKGARLGASLQWPEGITSTLFGSWRQRSYRAYSPLLAATRDDEEQFLTLVVKAPRLQFGGFVPVLSLRHNRTNSNVDWLYSYDRSSASLKLERSF